MKTFLLGLAFVAVAATAAIASESSDVSYWSHNGSIMILTDEGLHFEIAYLYPRVGMKEVGVVRGTTLVHARDDGTNLSGKEFFFHSRCGKQQFDVTGKGNTLADSKITLTGFTPKFDGLCNIIGYEKNISVFVNVENTDNRFEDDSDDRVSEPVPTTINTHNDSVLAVAPVLASPSATRCKITDPTGSPLNVRIAPNSRIVATIDNGWPVTILDTTAASQGESWAYVADYDTRSPIGWVFREFVSCY